MNHQQSSKPSDDSQKHGRLFIISAPSGAGKTTLCTAVLEKFPNLSYSVSHTTRPPRTGEREGVDYFFITRKEFENCIEDGKWAEWADVHGHYYGTSAHFIDRQITAGNDILLDIDVNGARQILSRYPDSITIFIMPPTFDTLRERLVLRGTDSEQVIARRLENGRSEIAQKDLYQHVVVNDSLPEAINALAAIITGGTHR